MYDRKIQAADIVVQLIQYIRHRTLPPWTTDNRRLHVSGSQVIQGILQLLRQFIAVDLGLCQQFFTGRSGHDRLQVA